MQIGWPLATKSALLTLLMAVGPMATAQTARPWVDPPGEGAAAPSQAPEPVSPAPPAASPPQAASPAPATPPAQAAQPQTPIFRPETPATRQAQQPDAPATRQTPQPETPVTRQAEQPQAPPPAAAPAPVTTARPKQDPADDRREARASTAKRFAIDYLTSWSAPNDTALESTAAFYAPRVLFHGREVSMKRLFDEKRRFVKRWPERDYRPREDGVGTTCNPAGEICTVHAVFDYTASHPRRRRVSQGTGALQLVVHFIGDRPVIVAEHSTLLGQERKRNLALEGVSND